MKTMRLLAFIAMAVVLADDNALAQTTTNAPLAEPTETTRALTEEAD